MSNQRFSPEFKDEAVRQIVDRGVSNHMDVLKHGGLEGSLVHRAPGPFPGKACGLGDGAGFLRRNQVNDVRFPRIDEGWLYGHVSGIHSDSLETILD